MAIPKLNKIVTNSESKHTDDNSTIVQKHTTRKIYDYVKYADGKDLEVDYYSYIRGNNDNNSLIDPNNPNQQYHLIKRMLIKVTTPISDSINYNDLKIEGYLTGIIPAKNDIICMKLNEDNVGMFRIDEISKKTYIQKEIYDIDIKFMYFKDTNINYFTSLYNKVKKTSVYDRDVNLNNSVPVVSEKKYLQRVNLKNVEEQLINYYIDTFTHQNTICYEDDNKKKVFDVNIQNLFLSLIDPSEYIHLHRIAMKSDLTIIDNIRNKDSLSLTKLTKYKLLPVQYDILNDNMLSLISSEMDLYVVADKTKSTPVDNKGKLIPLTVKSNDKEYIFGDLSDSDKLSTLELELLKYKENKLIDKDNLGRIIEDIDNWSKIEQFYYIPITLLVLQYSLLNNYTRIV